MVHAVWAHWISTSSTAQLHPLIILDTGTIYFTAIQEVLYAHNYPVVCIDPKSDTVEAIVEEVAVLAPSLILLGAWLDQAIIFELVQRISGAWPLIIIAWDVTNNEPDRLRSPYTNDAEWPIVSSTHDLEELLVQTLKW